MTLNHVKKNVNRYWGSSEPKIIAQQGSSRFMKTITKGELMTKGGNLFHISTIRKENPVFDVPNEKSDDASSPRRGEQADRVKNMPRGRL